MIDERYGYDIPGCIIFIIIGYVVAFIDGILYGPIYQRLDLL
jgi:hypothetical protein